VNALNAVLVLVASACVGWGIAAGSAVLSSYVVSAWSGDTSFVQALGWGSLGTWGMFGALFGFVFGAIAYGVWLRQLSLTELALAAPRLIYWTLLGAAISAALLFPLVLVGAPAFFFRACSRAVAGRRAVSRGA
jgi:hypothetical protein